MVEHEVPRSVAETKIISRHVETSGINSTNETQVIHRPVSSVVHKSGNNDDFRVTLDKIEEQLALSRKMYPS